MGEQLWSLDYTTYKPYCLCSYSGKACTVEVKEITNRFSRNLEYRGFDMNPARVGHITWTLECETLVCILIQ